MNQAIIALIQEGDQFVSQEKYKEAVETYEKAYDTISEKSDLKYAVWILSSIGEAFWKAKDYHSALSAFKGAIAQEGALGNPYLHMRLGQTTFELSDSWKLKRQELKYGKHWKASDELGRALIGGGVVVFRGEDEKYLAWIKNILKAPQEGWNGYIGATADLMTGAPQGTFIATLLASKA